MKCVAIIIVLAAIATASPITLHGADLFERQLGGTGSTANELEDGPCRDITYVFARGSTEPGNLGSSVGPALCDSLKDAYSSDMVACQGVGAPYYAGLASNSLPQGTTSAAIGEAKRLFTLAATKCPDTIIVASGYSQGAAVMTGAVGTSEVKDRIAGAVLFGDTRNLQTGGTIPGYPQSQTLIICNPGDLVCDGTLIITAAHLAYVPTVPRASSFLQDQIGL